MRSRALLSALVVVVVASCLLTSCSLKLPSQGDRYMLEERVVQHVKGTDNKILVIPLSGEVTSSSESGIFSSEANMVEELGMQLDRARNDDDVKGVILSINSPGGEVTASEIIYHKISKFKKERGIPVVVLMGNVAASGAYYISMAADEIVAHPSTITGSIGVISVFMNFKGLMDKIGVEAVTLKTGKMKDVGSSVRPMTEDEQEYINVILKEMYELFLDRVLSSRKELTRDQLLTLADGRVYTAKQALEAKLVDKIGFFDDAVSSVRRLANVESCSIVAYEWPWNRKYDVYSMMSPGAVDINLLKVNFGSLGTSARPGFYYLWAH